MDIAQDLIERKDELRSRPKKKFTPEQRARYSEAERLKYQHASPEEKAKKLEYQKRRRAARSEQQIAADRVKRKAYVASLSAEKRAEYNAKSCEKAKQNRDKINERRRKYPKKPRTDEQRQAAREYRAVWLARMTPEQLDALRQKAKERRAKTTKTPEQKAKDIAYAKAAYERMSVEERRAKARARYANLSQDKKAALRENAKKRYREDVNFNLTIRVYYGLRRKEQKRHIFNYARRALNRKGESAAFTAIAGYTIADLRIRLESLFTDGMSWERFMAGDIHIDHIKPLSSFDLTDMDQVRQAWAIDNLQPLWAKDNLRKGNKHPAKWQEACASL